MGYWKRLEAKGAFIMLEAVGDTNSAYVLEIEPGGSVKPERHLFQDRFDGREGFFNAEGKDMPGRVWETNFVEDVRTFPLLEYGQRGGGAYNRRFELAGATLIAHVAQFPVGT